MHLLLQMETGFACNATDQNTSLEYYILPCQVLAELDKQLTEAPKSCQHNLCIYLDHQNIHFECARKDVIFD